MSDAEQKDRLSMMAFDFCEGAFGPFDVEIAPYAKIVEQLLQHAVDTELTRLQQSNAALVEALKFYANPAEYTDAIPDFYSELDFAERAQTALANA